jgi:zinc protease
MQHEQRRLKNGLETLLINAPGSTSASVQIWFRAGSALEKEEDFGIAHFLEHMFFKGTPRRPGAGLAHEVESFGGEINAFTSFDYTCYYINTPANHLDQTVDILLDMVSNPSFLEEDLIPERDVVFEEYRRSIDNPGQFSFSKLQENFFTGGYQHPILGNEGTIKGFTREQLINFREKYYNLSNAMLVVAGDLKEKDAIIKTIEEYQMPKGGKSSYPAFELRKKPFQEIHNKEVRMAQLYMCLQSPNFSSSNAAQEDLAINCLGHGESSRIYQDLVLKDSLANSCGSSTMFMNDGGIHFIRVSFPVENFKKVLDRTYKNIQDILKNGFEDKEVDKIKNQYVASKVYDMESLESYAFSLGHGFAQAGDINCEEEFITRIKKTTASATNKGFSDAFSRPLQLSLQLPMDEKIKDFKKDLKEFQSKIITLAKQSKQGKEKKKSVKLSKFDPQVQLIKIKEGISLLYRQNEMAPTFVLHAYLKGGISEENKNNNGVYNALSGVLTKGHHKISYEKIKEFLENKSASLSGFSGKNAYGLTMHGQSEHFKDLLYHFSGSLLNPDLPNNRIKHEKEITLRQIEMHKEDPVKHCFKEVSKLHFNNHPYALPLGGSPATIKKITKKGLTELHQKNLRSKDMLFIYCGDKALDEVLPEIEEMTSGLKPRKAKNKQIKKVLPLSGKKIYIPFDREQTHIFIGTPTNKIGSKENLYLKILTTHLSGQSSELFVEVRDRQGLCYAAQPIHFSALEAGYWGIYMASGHDKVKAASKALEDLIGKVRENGLSEEDFNRVKKMIEGQSLLNVQTNDDYANIYSVSTLHGLGIDYYHKSNEMIRNLEHSEFNLGIKKVLKKKWNTVIVGRSED